MSSLLLTHQYHLIVTLSASIGSRASYACYQFNHKFWCSWLGMLPGTWAYVSAGAFGQAIIQEESEFGLPGGNGQLLTLGLGLLATALAAAYVTRLAKVIP
ncbi:hypothetical protein CK203_050280 [Vitis vinifera]|uniref:Uncharacterized protein n=1 Tax=Vitis vinifera TaxID=29760 RepID=A0A438GZ25_VITVI|nr:hypothetical protein CK203_050280 [Vitis vinifera]